MVLVKSDIAAAGSPRPSCGASQGSRGQPRALLTGRLTSGEHLRRPRAAYLVKRLLPTFPNDAKRSLGDAYTPLGDTTGASHQPSLTAACFFFRRCARTGALLHTLHGHASDVHVLQCHPTDKRLALTAGYDGKINVWDIERGCLQQSYAPLPLPHTVPVAITAPPRCRRWVPQYTSAKDPLKIRHFLDVRRIAPTPSAQMSSHQVHISA
jgi:WD40 repeat protein